MNTTLVFKKKEFPRVERCDSDSDENNSDNEEDLMVCPRSARASAPRALRAARSLRACTTS